MRLLDTVDQRRRESWFRGWTSWRNVAYQVMEYEIEKEDETW
jgi:hypothetical protein